MASYKVIHQPGQYHDSSALNDVLGYCLQPKKTPGGFIFSRNVDANYAAEEMNDVATAYGKDSGLRLRHSVLSFSPNEEIDKADATEIAQQVLEYYGDKYQIVAAIHEDTDNPHIHFVMNQVSFQNGAKYRGQKDDYYRFERYLKGVLSDHGIRKLILGEESASEY